MLVLYVNYPLWCWKKIVVKKGSCFFYFLFLLFCFCFTSFVPLVTYLAQTSGGSGCWVRHKEVSWGWDILIFILALFNVFCLEIIQIGSTFWMFYLIILYRYRINLSIYIQLFYMHLYFYVYILFCFRFWE